MSNEESDKLKAYFDDGYLRPGLGEQDNSSESEKVAQERKKKLEQDTNFFSQKLDITSSSKDDDNYFDPRVEVEDAAGVKFSLSIFEEKIAQFRTVVVEPLQIGSIADREKAQGYQAFLENEILPTLEELNLRVKEIEAKKLIEEKELFYKEPVNKPIERVKSLLKLPEATTDRDRLEKEILFAKSLLSQSEKLIKNIRSEIKVEVEVLLKELQERTARNEKKLLDIYKTKSGILELIKTDTLKNKTQAFFDSTTLLKDDEVISFQKLQSLLQDALEKKSFYLKHTFQELSEELKVKKQSPSGEVFSFPNNEQILEIKNHLQNLIDKKIFQLQERLKNERRNSIEPLIAKINGITEADIQKTDDRPSRVSYSEVKKLKEQAEQSLNDLPINVDKSLIEIKSNLDKAINKLKRLIDQFEFVHPEYLSDEDLLNLMFSRNINPYDYPGWRSTTKDNRLLVIRNEWMGRTEATGLTPEADLVRARLKVRFIIPYFKNKLISGKQLPSIAEDEVISTLQNALLTRQDLIKGYQINSEGTNNNTGKSIRDMMWTVAKNAALKPDYIAARKYLDYATMSDAPDGGEAEILKVLKEIYPDSKGYTDENRNLAANGAVIFRFLTSALTELMKQTQTGAHEVAGNEDSLLIENIFKYAMHVIFRYNQPEHPWVELLMLMEHIPEDWAPNDQMLEHAKDFMNLIIKYYKIFGDPSGFVGQIQSPGFMRPLFPNMLELSGLQTDETILVGEKLYAYGNVHFATSKEYITKPDGTKILVKERKIENEFDYNVASGSVVNALRLQNELTNEIIGARKLSKVVLNGRELKGTFHEIKAKDIDLTDIDLDTPEGQRYVFEKTGVFFTDESGKVRRIVRSVSDNNSVVVDIGDFQLEEEIDEVDKKTVYSWQKISQENIRIEDLTKPRFYIIDSLTNKPVEAVGAYINQDEYGVWVYDRTNKPLGAYKNGKILRAGDTRGKEKFAQVVGYEAGFYQDENGQDIEIGKNVFLKDTSILLGSEADKVSLKRTIAFSPDAPPELIEKLGNKFVFRRDKVYLPVGLAEDLILKYGDAREKLERKAELEHHPIKKRYKYEQVAFVDISQRVPISADGTRTLGYIDLSGRVLEKNGDEEVLIGTINNENVILSPDGKAVGLASFPVRESKNKKIIGYVLPELVVNQNKKDYSVPGSPVELLAAGLEDDIDLALGGFVNTFEKYQVARGAYQKLWESIPEELPSITPDELAASSKGDKSELHKLFAGFLGKIKMQHGPHMSMYGPLCKFIIYRFIQKIKLHSGKDTQETLTAANKEMKSVWFEIYTLLTGMLEDTGLSGAFTTVLEDILDWMEDDKNDKFGKEGMNHAFTRTYWSKTEGRVALMEYLDAYWKLKNKPNPHGPGVGMGAGFFELGGRDVGRMILAMETRARTANVAGNTTLRDSIYEYLKNFKVDELAHGLDDVVKPFERKGAQSVKDEIKKEK